MGKHIVGSESELKQERQRIVVLEGRSVGVFFRDDRWFAIRNVCPHHGAELCRGVTSGAVRMTDEFELVYELDNQIIRCPWHGFEFDLRTGRSLVDPEGLRVKTYDIAVEEGSVTVTI